jgi:hypothetical protein
MAGQDQRISLLLDKVSSSRERAWRGASIDLTLGFSNGCGWRQTTDYDKDERYMATSDLCNELNNNIELGAYLEAKYVLLLTVLTKWYLTLSS